MSFGSPASVLYDAAGNLTSDGTYAYTYDAWNRLVTVATVGENATTVATYTYDGQGHRTSKTVGSVTTDYYYDSAWRVVEERVGGNVTAQYVYGAQWPDVPIARITASQTLFYATDAAGKVTSVVDGATGQVVERYVYDPYGAVTFLKADWSLQNGDLQHAAGTISQVGNEILYAGYRYDAESGLYNLRCREYHPELGRFLQRDPVGYAAGSMNLYGYASTDPISGWDPMGLTEGPASSAPRPGGTFDRAGYGRDIYTNGLPPPSAVSKKVVSLLFRMFCIAIAVGGVTSQGRRLFSMAAGVGVGDDELLDRRELALDGVEP